MIYLTETFNSSIDNDDARLKLDAGLKKAESVFILKNIFLSLALMIYVLSVIAWKLKYA